MPKETNAGAPPVMDKAFYEKIKPFKKRIIKRWVKQYYQTMVWASQDWHHLGIIMVAIDQTFKKPELCATMYGLYKSALNYFDFTLPGVDHCKPLMGELMALHKLYEQAHKKGKIGGYIREVFPGTEPTRLSKTQASRELLARGFVHVADVVKTWDKTKYSIVPIHLGLTWPYQFESQQDGMAFLEGFGIPGYTGCPSPEQGQLALYSRY